MCDILYWIGAVWCLTACLVDKVYIASSREVISQVTCLVLVCIMHIIAIIRLLICTLECIWVAQLHAGTASGKSDCLRMPFIFMPHPPMFELCEWTHLVADVAGVASTGVVWFEGVLLMNAFMYRSSVAPEASVMRCCPRCAPRAKC